MRAENGRRAAAPATPAQDSTRGSLGDQTITAASTANLAAVVRLLDAAGLPSRDLTASMMSHFLVATRGDALLGVIGLEPLGGVGLLRSLAVAGEQRGLGIGIALTRALEGHAKELGIADLYLLTTTAEGFFSRLGYRVLPRPEAPAPIQGTTEYRELCSSTSICMVKRLA